MKHLWNLCGVIFCLLIVSSCHIDDTSPNPALRLPFENLDELFARQDIETDTAVINASADATIFTSTGAKIIIYAGSFEKNNVTVDGDVSIITRELFKKSEMVLLNKPSTSGNSILEYGGVMDFSAFKNNEGINLQSPITVTLPVSDQVSALGDMSHYNRSGSWVLVNNSPVEVSPGAMTLQFNSVEDGWMCGAMQTGFSEFTPIDASPYGYGTILTDITGFVVLSDYNTVIQMDGDINGIKVSKTNIPKGVEASIVIIAMDHFRLFVGIKTLEITSNLSTEIKMNEVTEAGLAEALQILD